MTLIVFSVAGLTLLPVVSLAFWWYRRRSNDRSLPSNDDDDDDEGAANGQYLHPENSSWIY